MRQINFLIIFIVCLALVLFSLQNTEPVVVQIVQGVQVQAPLCVELILAMGLGAILAWLFSGWTIVQRWLATRQEVRQIRQKEQRIQELEQNIERYKADIIEPHQLAPGTTLQAEVISKAELLK